MYIYIYLYIIYIYIYIHIYITLSYIKITKKASFHAEGLMQEDFFSNICSSDWLFHLECYFLYN